MNHVADATPTRVRAAALWAAVTAATLPLGWMALGEAVGLLHAPGPDFSGLLVQLCAPMVVVALTALWLLTTDVAWQVLRGSSQPRGRRRTGPLRSLLLAACGVAVLSGTTTTASFAHEGPGAPLTAELLDGLPLPDRATGEGPHHRVHQRAASDDSTRVRVGPGDSLWLLAERALGPAASEADVASYSRRIHAANVAVIGPDPDLLHPDQHLHLPAR